MSIFKDETASISNETASISNETASISNETASISNETASISNETASIPAVLKSFLQQLNRDDLYAVTQWLNNNFCIEAITNIEKNPMFFPIELWQKQTENDNPDYYDLNTDYCRVLCGHILIECLNKSDVSHEQIATTAFKRHFDLPRPMQENDIVVIIDSRTLAGIDWFMLKDGVVQSRNVTIGQFVFPKDDWTHN